MGYLFFDVESYVSEQNNKSGFNPYEREAKTLVISYNYYPGFSAPKKGQLKKPAFLCEWESSEKKILVDFYHIIKNMIEREMSVDKKTGQEFTKLKFVGFNILKYDLPYLFGRMETHGIDNKQRLFQFLFVKPIAVDLYYMTPLVSQKTREYKQLWGISQKEVNKFFGLQVKEGTGDELSRFYDRKEYGKIIKYCLEEFTFEQLYDAFLMHILEKG